MRFRSAVTITALAAAQALSCARPAPAPPLQSGGLRGGNVLLVTIDTLRRDRVGAYGTARGLTPTLDRLSSSGVRFTQAFSHAPMTLPAHASILTGRTPRTHGIHVNGSSRLGDGVATLATVLKQSGYRTGAFVGAFVLDARYGLSRGFDEYDDRYPHETDAATFNVADRRAAEVVEGGGRLDSRPAAGSDVAAGSPWFAWVHLFDPHTPYDAPAEYRAGRSPYDGEVAYTDAMLGQLLDRLGGARALDRTLDRRNRRSRRIARRARRDDARAVRVRVDARRATDRQRSGSRPRCGRRARGACRHPADHRRSARGDAAAESRRPVGGQCCRPPTARCTSKRWRRT